jgi:hypothetical protein
MPSFNQPYTLNDFLKKDTIKVIKEQLRHQISEHANAVIFFSKGNYLLWKDNHFIKDEDNKRRYPPKLDFQFLFDKKPQPQS